MPAASRKRPAEAVTRDTELPSVRSKAFTAAPWSASYRVLTRPRLRAKVPAIMTSPRARPLPKFAYVGCYTTKERNGRGEGINVYRIDDATGAWTHVQLLRDLVNPSWRTDVAGGIATAAARNQDHRGGGMGRGPRSS